MSPAPTHSLTTCQRNAARRRRRAANRTGAVLIGVLACLLIGSVLVGFIMQTALRGRREARLVRQMAQTQWLCEAGLIRATTALEKSEDYRGELWQPELDIEPLCNASVEIKVEQSAAENEPSKGHLKIQVTAQLDSTSDLDGPMQRTQSLTLQPTSENNSQSEQAQ